MSVYDKFLYEQAIAVSGSYDFGNLKYINHNGKHILSKEVTKELTNFVFNNKKLHIVKYTPKPEIYLLVTEYIEPQTTEDGKIYDYKERWYVIGAIVLSPVIKLKS